MTEIVGIRFQNSGKVYYFAPNELTLPMGTQVVVETTRGLECGTVSIPNRKVPSETIVSPLTPVTKIVCPLPDVLPYWTMSPFLTPDMLFTRGQEDQLPPNTLSATSLANPQHCFPPAYVPFQVE